MSKALLESQAHQGTSLFTSAATNQRGGFPKGGSREAQVRFPEYQNEIEVVAFTLICSEVESVKRVTVYKVCIAVAGLGRL